MVPSLHVALGVACVAIYAPRASRAVAREWRGAGLAVQLDNHEREHNGNDDDNGPAGEDYLLALLGAARYAATL